MAKEVIINLRDDLNGEIAEKTVYFTIEGTHYEIDLSTDNIEAFKEAIAPYVTKARLAGVSKLSGKEERDAVRVWAKERGIKVGTQGRISSEIIQQYRDAH
jgi:hypothetical protein